MRRRRSRAAKTATPMANTNTGYDNNPGYNNNGAAHAGNTGYNNGPAYGGQAQYAPPNNPPPQQYGGGNEGYYGQQNGVAQPQGAYMKWGDREEWLSGGDGLWKEGRLLVYDERVGLIYDSDEYLDALEFSALA